MNCLLKNDQLLSFEGASIGNVEQEANGLELMVSVSLAFQDDGELHVLDINPIQVDFPDSITKVDFMKARYFGCGVTMSDFNKSL